LERHVGLVQVFNDLVVAEIFNIDKSTVCGRLKLIEFIGLHIIVHVLACSQTLYETVAIIFRTVFTFMFTGASSLLWVLASMTASQWVEVERITSIPLAPDCLIRLPRRCAAVRLFRFAQW